MEVQKNILITGASGFVGAHLTEKALEEGYAVYALVRESSSFVKHPEVQYLYADVTEYEILYHTLRTLKREGIELDYIIHAAALTKSNSKSKIDQVNYTGTLNLYKSLERLDWLKTRVVMISSLAASGPQKKDQLISILHPNPVTTYGKSKLKAEKFALEASENTVIIRPTAIYGPGDKDMYSIFKMVQGNFNPLLGAHPQQLTFIYVKDLVNIVFSALETGKAGKIYFATDGHVYNKKEFPGAIARSLHKKPLTITFPLFAVKWLSVFSQYLSAMAGKTSSLNREKYKELIAESWMCDVEYTFTNLNYQPKYDLNSGITETTKWYKLNKWLK